MSGNTSQGVSRLKAIIPSLLAATVGLATLTLSAAAHASPAGSFATPGPASSTPTQVVVTETNDQQVVTVPRGAVVTLVLHSTSWRLAGSSRPGTLRPMDRPAYRPVPPRFPECFPGMACGTVTAHYKALTSGNAVVSAGRTYCGEVMPCTPANDAYTVTIHIR